MPELPEVEVVRLFLEPYLVGSAVTDLEILTPKSFIGDPCLLIGQKIIKLTRIGKQLSLHLENGHIALIHLKMTGQLILVPDQHSRLLMGHPTKNMDSEQLPNRSTRLIFTFKSSLPPVRHCEERSDVAISEFARKREQFLLYFNDQRKFGWVRLFSRDDLALAQSGLGKDIFDPALTPSYFYSQLQRSSRPVKLVLLDQSFFAGIGNIYANDALFLAGIHPKTPSRLVSRHRSRRLLASLIEIMRQSVLAGGSTTKDKKYLKPDGNYGQNQFRFRVYQREGEPCLVCRRPLARIKLGGRGTFFCSHCQRL